MGPILPCPKKPFGKALQEQGRGAAARRRAWKAGAEAPDPALLHPQGRKGAAALAAPGRLLLQRRRRRALACRPQIRPRAARLLPRRLRPVAGRRQAKPSQARPGQARPGQARPIVPNRAAAPAVRRAQPDAARPHRAAGMSGRRPCRGAAARRLAAAGRRGGGGGRGEGRAHPFSPSDRAGPAAAAPVRRPKRPRRRISTGGPGIPRPRGSAAPAQAPAIWLKPASAPSSRPRGPAAPAQAPQNPNARSESLAVPARRLRAGIGPASRAAGRRRRRRESRQTRRSHRQSSGSCRPPRWPTL